MSMALGAFLAGVLLAESNYRHELEADIEPFRGLLLALFFMGVGMTIDMTIVRANSLAHHRRRASPSRCSRPRSSGLLFRVDLRARAATRCAPARCSPRAGEFAFVLIPLGVALGVLERRARRSLLAAIAAITMLLGPPFATLTEKLLHRLARRDRARGRRFRRRARLACW